MKKSFAFFLLIISLFFVCGCTQFDVEDFSYVEDYNYYKDAPGLKQSNFVNTERTEVQDANQAVELAKKECTVPYDSIAVAFDAGQKIYRINFYKKGWLGGDQSVYINQEGLTQLILYGE